MDTKMNKVCPFTDKSCIPECALYISTDELNETVKNRLHSIGVVSMYGDCSLKNLALAEMRKIFENTGVSRH